jgi:hypothetical protein
MTLELTLEQINIIMGALGNAPYVQVAAVIAEIQKQAAPQIKAPAEPAAAE